MPSLQWIVLPQNFSTDQRGWSFAPFKDLALIENNYTLVIIPPGISHAVKNESPGITYLIAFRSPAVSGENPEVIRSVLIP
jgi:hypothetical protein